MTIVVKGKTATVEIQAKPMAAIQSAAFDQCVAGLVPLDKAEPMDVVGVFLEVAFTGKSYLKLPASMIAVMGDDGKPRYVKTCDAVHYLPHETAISILSIEGEYLIEYMTETMAQTCVGSGTEFTQFDCLITAHGMLVGADDVRQHVEDAPFSDVVSNAAGIVEARMHQPDSAHDLLDRVRNADALTKFANEFFVIDASQNTWDEGVGVSTTQDGQNIVTAEKIRWTVRQPAV
jgi:hypothetical protein